MLFFLKHQLSYAKKIEIAEPGDLRLFLLPGQEMTEIKKGLNNLENDLNSGHGLVSTATGIIGNMRKTNQDLLRYFLVPRVMNYRKKLKQQNPELKNLFPEMATGALQEAACSVRTHCQEKAKSRLHIQEVSAPMFIAGVPSSKCIRGYTSLTSSL